MVAVGTTSACAENTNPAVGTIAQTGNYLRVRGEYFCRGFGQACEPELPPRARRIPVVESCYPHRKGTTSACAENTEYTKFGLNLTGNYLRVRGEYYIGSLYGAAR